MTDLQAGDQIKDNDPRMATRILIVTKIDGERVVAKDSRGRVFWYLRRRIFTDNRPRKSGFSKINAPDTTRSRQE